MHTWAAREDEEGLGGMEAEEEEEVEGEKSAPGDRHLERRQAGHADTLWGGGRREAPWDPLFFFAMIIKHKTNVKNTWIILGWEPMAAI